MCFFAIGLFSHAKMLEDVVEGFLGGDGGACDVAEGGEDEAEVFGKEVAREVCVEAVEDTEEMGVGCGEGGVMTCIGDDDVGVGKMREIGGLEDFLLERFDMIVGLGTDEKQGSEVGDESRGGGKKVGLVVDK